MQLVKLLHVGTQFSHEELLCHEDQRETVQHACEPHLCFRNLGLDFDTNQRIDSRRDSRRTIGARIKVDSHERYHD